MAYLGKKGEGKGSGGGRFWILCPIILQDTVSLFCYLFTNLWAYKWSLQKFLLSFPSLNRNIFNTSHVGNTLYA